MTAPGDYVHDLVLAEIERRIKRLTAGAPTSKSLIHNAGTGAESDVELERLGRDRASLLAHWRMRDGVVAEGAPTRARACGRPQPCPHVLELAQRYAILG